MNYVCIERAEEIIDVSAIAPVKVLEDDGDVACFDWWHGASSEQ